MTLADRAKAIAAAARQREPGPDPDKFQVAREWWRIGTIELFCCPPMTLREVQGLYPGAKIEPML